ncbi:MAG: rhomboid family intramembrane serine protease [Limisphaerales bacterium]
MSILRRISAWLTPGTRWLLFFWMIGCVLRYTSFESQFGLAAPALRHGQVWRLVSYPWMPQNMLNFIINGVALGILGGALERRWSGRTLLSYSFVVVILVGATWAFLPFAGSGAWYGSGPLLFGLLVAWGRTCGDQGIYLGPVATLTAMTAALVFGGLSLLMTAMTAGWRSALFLALGAAWGLVYLWVRSRQGEGAASSSGASQRISRLEL